MMDALKTVSRRGFIAANFALIGTLAADADPWPADALMPTEELAGLMKQGKGQHPIICVAFPVLYRQRHISGAVFAGPGSKPEGIALLKPALAKQKASDLVVLYCGCCPMTRCPNVRPAYLAAKDLGFKNVRVLDLQTNLHTDWIAKGYPVESRDAL